LSGNPLSKTNEVNVNTVKYNSNSMFLTPTTEEEVVGIIKGLGNKKSMGLDDIPESSIIQNIQNFWKFGWIRI
jgi:hypothetical protein